LHTFSQTYIQIWQIPDDSLSALHSTYVIVFLKAFKCRHKSLQALKPVDIIPEETPICRKEDSVWLCVRSAASVQMLLGFCDLFTVNLSTRFPRKSHLVAQNVDTKSVVIYWCILNAACSPFFFFFKLHTEMFQVFLLISFCWSFLIPISIGDYFTSVSWFDF